MKIEWRTEEVVGVGRQAGVDPSTWWLLGGGAPEFLPPAPASYAAHGGAASPERWLTSLLTLATDEEVESFKALLEEGRARVPGFVPSAKPGRPFCAFLAYLDETFTPPFVTMGGGAAAGGRAGARGALKLSPAIVGDWTPDPGDPVVSEAPEGSVITAVIDDGLVVAHERFRDEDGDTRVHHFWMMGAAPPAAGTTVEFGREWCKGGKQGLDALLEQARGRDKRDKLDKLDERVDEDRFLRLAGMVDPGEERLGGAMRRLSHGTHVMDLAAGHPPADHRTDRPIIAVQLPSFAVEDTSGATLDALLALALDYVRDRARRIATEWDLGALPVVVNLSYGYTAGAHDGSAAIERLMDLIVNGDDGDPRTQIVLSAGNAHLQRGYAEAPPPAPPPDRPGEDGVELAWRVQTDDRTPSLLQMWLPPLASFPRPPGRVEIEVKPPFGAWSEPLGEDDSEARVLVRTDAHGSPPPPVASLHYGVEPSSGRGLFELRLRPTARMPGDPTPLEVAPAGSWRIRVRILDDKAINAETPLQAWVQRSDSLPGYPMRGRQSHLEHPDHPDPTPSEYAVEPVLKVPERRRDPSEKQWRNGPIGERVPVRRENLLNAIATGARPLVVGGYERKRRFAMPFSAGGSEGAATLSPTLLADASDGLAARGVLAAGARSGAWVAMGGTSVAAPRVARLAVEAFASGLVPTRNAVAFQALSIDDATAARGREDLPEDRGGAGRLRLGRGRDLSLPGLGDGAPVDRDVAEEP